MTDREKVIEGLQEIVDSEWMWKKADYWARICKNALALLKEQEPVEPDVDVDTWICGKCGHTLEHQELVGNNILFHEQYSYCPNCGRKVKWDAED